MTVTVMKIITCMSYTISIIKKLLEVIRPAVGIKSLNTHQMYALEEDIIVSKTKKN